MWVLLSGESSALPATASGRNGNQMAEKQDRGSAAGFLDYSESVPSQVVPTIFRGANGG